MVTLGLNWAAGPRVCALGHCATQLLRPTSPSQLPQSKPSSVSEGAACSPWWVEEGSGCQGEQTQVAMALGELIDSRPPELVDHLRAC